MASLEAAKKKVWKEALLSTSATWVICGLRLGQGENASAFDGMLGLVDWAVHGQVSRLVQSGSLQEGASCVVPGLPEGRRPSFLIFSLSGKSSPQALVASAKKLGIDGLALAESTFPEDFLGKLKQTFKKEGIRFTTLEPET